MRRAVAFTAFPIALVAAALVVAGPLAPPAGPIASSYKTLSEVEPRIAVTAANTPGDSDSVFRIAQPGSYYLAGNVNVPSGKHGVEIAADGVTLDLSGFSIAGVPGSFDGITVSTVARKRITIRNGVVRAMGSDGIELWALGADGSQAWGLEVEGVTISGCVGAGMRMVPGRVRDCQFDENGAGLYIYGESPSVVQGSSATGNTSYGLSVGNGVLADCSARSNGAIGISMGNAGVVRDCHSEANQWGFGVVNTTISGCTAYNNSAGGISSNARSTIVGNYIVSTTLVPGSIGISLGYDACRVEDNNIVTQATAIRAATGNNLIVGNTFRYCTTAVNAAAGNRIGTIVIGSSSAAVNGNSGGGMGTTDPYANIIY